MMAAGSNEIYPRSLKPDERSALEFVLPSESKGYSEYRSLIDGMVVLSEGRRGSGNFVLGREGDRADITSPLEPVIAYGVIESAAESITITVREFVGEQIDIEIVSGKGEGISRLAHETRRWTYSGWKPGFRSPNKHEVVREIKIGDAFLLVIAKEERRLWLHDGNLRMNHLIPITNFYNELMIYKRIRDPKIALKSAIFFQDIDGYTDGDLRAAFIAYNKLKRRVTIKDNAMEEKISFFQKLKRQ